MIHVKTFEQKSEVTIFLVGLLIYTFMKDSLKLFFIVSSIDKLQDNLGHFHTRCLVFSNHSFSDRRFSVNMLFRMKTFRAHYMLDPLVSFKNGTMLNKSFLFNQEFCTVHITTYVFINQNMMLCCVSCLFVLNSNYQD